MFLMHFNLIKTKGREIFSMIDQIYESNRTCYLQNKLVVELFKISMNFAFSKICKVFCKLKEVVPYYNNYECSHLRQ